MKVLPVSFDSFSTRSMATLIETDVKIIIDPSVAVGPKRYGLPPHEIELIELNNSQQRIIGLSKYVDLVIITHYHWDHCPSPNSKHFNVLYGKNILAKSFKENVNRSQGVRGRTVYVELKNKAHFIFADNKEYNLNNTTILFSEPVWHGMRGSKLGYVLMALIQYKNDSILFASDIQGVLDNKTKNIISEFNPTMIIMSGPATYHNFWRDRLLKISNSNIKEIIEKTSVKNIIVDHHLTRDLYFREKIKDLIYFANQFGVTIQTAAEYLGIKNKLLEARRKELYNNI
ncbi:MAG TPA: hypothetical protein EYH22_03725 [Candidatus Nanopusillus sp.]|nr:hypothetical protein [Candidatus Nanopusillus sp.]